MRHFILIALVLWAAVKAALLWPKRWERTIGVVKEPIFYDGASLTFVIHRCALSVGASCGRDPCIVPEGRVTKWERFGSAYDGFIFFDGSI